jgi:hypothetical protein
MKPRNVEASVYDTGNGELQVWGVSFTIPGHLHKDASGRIAESDRNRIIKQIKKALAELDFPNEEVHSTND